MKKYTGIQKGEDVQVGYADKGGNRVAFLTRKGDTFYMYKVGEDGNCVKLGKGRSPPELEEKFNVLKLCGI